VNKSPDMPKQCIYLVDDDDALRDSLAWLLESSGHNLCAFASAEAFLEGLDEVERGCVLLDVRMGGMSGIELFEQLRAQNFHLPVIFLTGHGEVPMAVEALKRGAYDFIEKPFGDKQLISLVDAALKHERDAHDSFELRDEVERRFASLTQREREVLRLILAGRLNKQIADELSISIKTVEVHRARVMEKMSANSIAELVRDVMRIEPDFPTP